MDTPSVAVYTIGYDSALRRKDIQTQAMAWMNLEDIMLGEISWPHTDKYCLIPLMRDLEE
jgi:hypothetical protein